MSQNCRIESVLSKCHAHLHGGNNFDKTTHNNKCMGSMSFTVCGKIKIGKDEKASVDE